MKRTAKTDAFILRLETDPVFAERLREKAAKALDKPIESQEFAALLEEFAFSPADLNKLASPARGEKKGMTTTTTTTTLTTVACRTTMTTTTTTEVPYLCN